MGKAIIGGPVEEPSWVGKRPRSQSLIVLALRALGDKPWGEALLARLAASPGVWNAGPGRVRALSAARSVEEVAALQKLGAGEILPIDAIEWAKDISQRTDLHAVGDDEKQAFLDMMGLALEQGLRLDQIQDGTSVLHEVLLGQHCHPLFTDVLSLQPDADLSVENAQKTSIETLIDMYGLADRARMTLAIARLPTPTERRGP